MIDDTSRRADKPRVMMLQMPKAHFDTSPAREFGEVLCLFHGRMSPYDENFADELLAALDREGFVDTRDYLCVTGSVNTLVIAAAVMMDRYDCLQLLMYDPVRYEYFAKTLRSMSR